MAVQRHSFLTGGVTSVLTACRQIKTITDKEIKIKFLKSPLSDECWCLHACNVHANKLELSGFCELTGKLTLRNSQASDVSKMVKPK